MPRLSIGIPVYNGQEYLAELLQSLLTQTFEDFEILICDNASNDRTGDICREFERRDRRVHYTCNERNLGAVANFNRVFEMSTAPLFKWAAHDDLYHSDYLGECIRLLDATPDVVLAHSGTAFIDDQGRKLPFEEATAAFVEPTTGRRYWADDTSIADSPVAVRQFWQVLTRACWGTHMFGVVPGTSCSKRPSCRILPAATGRCWRSSPCSAASSAPASASSTSASMPTFRGR